MYRYRIEIEPELLESLYWGNGYSLYHIGLIFGCSLETIRNRMKKYGIAFRSRGRMVTDFTFNDRQREIFEGCMLGDGGLVWMTSYCYFSNGDTFEEYLIWLQKQLGVEDISRIASRYNSDFTDIIDGYVLETRVIPSIRRDGFKRWYPYDTIRGTNQNRNNKIIPKDIELTPIKMLFWYLGDGNYRKDRGAASFCNCLVFEDWLLLSGKVCNVLDVDGGVSIVKVRKDKYGIQRHELHLGVVATRKFFDMVDSLDFDIPECYQYKFGI